MTVSKTYSYAASIKSSVSDEIVNIYLQRPVAGVVTRVLFPTRISPNQVTLLSTLCGVAGGMVLALPAPSFVVAAFLFYAKDILDSADGQLARAREQYSRRGRFYDSIGDFVVNAFLFFGISVWLLHNGISLFPSVLLGATGFLGVNLRVSYHVFYQSSFLHTQSQYSVNRVSEELAASDEGGEDAWTRLLHRIFLFLYGWQDRLIAAIDLASHHRRSNQIPNDQWYCNAAALRLNGLFGLGTEYVALTGCLLAGSISAYLCWSLLLENILWGAAVVYRWIWVKIG